MTDEPSAASASRVSASGEGVPVAADASLSVPLEPERVHVALGSNLGDRAATLARACDSLRVLAVGGRLRCSPLYESAPMGPSDQPDYLNAVCTFATRLAPEALLAALQRIENEAGRVRPAPRWSARTLDLDLLLFGDRRIDTPDLTVPHAGVAERAFVLLPLTDLDAALDVPGRGAVGELLAALDTSGIRVVSVEGEDAGGKEGG